MEKEKGGGGESWEEKREKLGKETKKRQGGGSWGWRGDRRENKIFNEGKKVAGGRGDSRPTNTETREPETK